MRISTGSGDGSRGDTLVRRVRLGCIVVSLALGVIYAWKAVPQVGPDGIAYLDLADALRRGDLRQGVSTLWSPLYPLLLAAVFQVLRPAPSLEFAVICLTNLIIYAGALAAVDFLLRQVIALRPRREDGSPAGRHPLPEWAVWAFGYGVFAFSALELIRVETVTPDMLVALTVYLSAGLLLKTARPSASPWTYALLGAAAGVGYLAKAPMLLPGLITLALAALNAHRVFPRRRAATRILAAAAACGLLVGALAVTYRETRGRLTLGDSARLNYAWLINGLPFAHWRGQPPQFGTPAHPTRRLMERPPVFEFASPVGGTYPPWFDPAYWYEGVTPRLDLRAHARALVRGGRHILYDILLRRQIALVAALAALAYLGGRPRGVRSGPTPHWLLLIPAVATVGMYALIRVENRFVAPFITLGWLGVTMALQLPASAEVRRGGEAIILGALIGLLVPSVGGQALGLLANPRLGGGLHLDWRAAQGLHRAGIRSGDRIAVIGFGFGAYWARLAGVRIVAEICAERPAPPWICAGERTGMREFWTARRDVKQQVFAAFRQAGARAVVAGSVEDVNLEAMPPPSDWVPIPGTPYYVRFLD